MHTLETNREAKEENKIQDPKSILHGMRKTTEYFETKLALLQRIAGMDFLAESFEDSFRERVWMKGHYRYKSEDDVLELFKLGEPLSCFCCNSIHHEVYIAFADGKRKIDGTEYTSMIKFSCINNLYHKEDYGVHFCQFEYVDTMSQVCKTQLNITDNALMLPYHHKGAYLKQYTLIYSDWEGLYVDNISQPPVKKRPCASKKLFEAM